MLNVRTLNYSDFGEMQFVDGFKEEEIYIANTALIH